MRLKRWLSMRGCGGLHIERKAEFCGSRELQQLSKRKQAFNQKKTHNFVDTDKIRFKL
jgi:hypothetical protein